MSPENQRAARTLEEGIKKLEVGYEAPILWKPGQPDLPNNRQLAETRCKSLIRRFQQDGAFERRYRQAMQTNFDEGYAVRLGDSELTEETPSYFLPHFGVDKPPGKLRIVFDAAAKYKGRCLNDIICSGPPLQNPLPSVVIKFREGEIAWTSDIKGMYNRIRLSKADRRFHRFLWPEEDGSTSVCEMTRLTFGVNCSPYVAIKTTWQAAADAGPGFEDVMKAVKSNFYVDDYLGSASTNEQAVRIATRVQSVLSKADFPLRGWTSNSAEFLAAVLPPSEGATNSERAVALGDNETEKVLGIRWTPSRDTLRFTVSGVDEVEYTRVGLTSNVASLFDPQGSAAPLTVKAKIRLRTLCIKVLQCNDPVDGDEKE